MSLRKRNMGIEGELKALASELKVNEKVSSNIEQSFEAKIQDILIRTNPHKYLTDQRRPKEGIILAFLVCVCVCEHCVEMPTREERVCCGKSQQYCLSMLPVYILVMIFAQTFTFCLCI